MTFAVSGGYADNTVVQKPSVRVKAQLRGKPVWQFPTLGLNTWKACQHELT
jgi:hypothetical protein